MSPVVPAPPEVVLREVCSRAGLDARGARVLHVRANAVYHLPRDRAVARLRYAPDAAAVLERLTAAVAVTRWLHGQGFPATEPLAIDQPVIAGGYIATFWRHVRASGAAGRDVVSLARLLRRLHAFPLAALECQPGGHSTHPGDTPDPGRPATRTPQTGTHGQPPACAATGCQPGGHSVRPGDTPDPSRPATPTPQTGTHGQPPACAATGCQPGGHGASPGDVLGAAGPGAPRRAPQSKHGPPCAAVQIPETNPLGSLYADLRGSDGVTPAQRDWLLARAAELERQYAGTRWALGAGLIHGDAHAGNLLHGRGVVVLGDWDSVSIGPREQDLTPASMWFRFGRPASEWEQFCAAYGVDPGALTGLPLLRRLRELRSLASYVRRAGDPAFRAEVSRRVGDLMSGAQARPWVPL